MTPAPCLYCGRTVGGGKLHSHPGACVRNPAVHARVAAVIADPDRPGYALASPVYEIVAQQRGLPARTTLTAEYGNWAAVCAAFGLKPPARRGGYRPHAAPVTERLAALDAEVERMQAAAEPANPYREWSGLPVCGVREIDGGRRLAWMVR